MAQTAKNGWETLPRNTWVLISEINCTFTVERGPVEILGMDGAAPDGSDNGITYRDGEGEEASTDMLGRFAGAGTADRLYAISRGSPGLLFISRAAVA